MHRRFLCTTDPFYTHSPPPPTHTHSLTHVESAAFAGARRHQGGQSRDDQRCKGVQLNQSARLDAQRIGRQAQKAAAVDGAESIL